MTCLFCQIQQTPLFATQHFFLVWDIDPIQNGHLLIIAKRHLKHLEQLSDEEALDLLHLQQRLSRTLTKQDSRVDLTFVCNNGQLMDEGTHLHIHAIPRQSTDGFWEKVTPQPFHIDYQSWRDRWLED